MERSHQPLPVDFSASFQPPKKQLRPERRLEAAIEEQLCKRTYLLPPLSAHAFETYQNHTFPEQRRVLLKHKSMQAKVEVKDASTCTDDSLLEALLDQRLRERSLNDSKCVDVNMDLVDPLRCSPFSEYLDILNDTPDLSNFTLGPIFPNKDVLYMESASVQDISYSSSTVTGTCTADSPPKTIITCTEKSPGDRWKAQLFLDLKCCDQIDASGNTPLHNAVINNNLNMVRRYCLALRLRQLDINMFTYEGYTPLMLAVLHDCSVNILTTLLYYGADMSVIDSNGNTIIHLCVQYSSEENLKTLLATKENIEIDRINHEGYTPLIVSAMHKKFEQVNHLLQYGAEPNILDKKSGRTALFYAVENDDSKIVRLLMDFKADPKIKNYFGYSSHDCMFELDCVSDEVKQLIFRKEETADTGKKRRKRSGSGDHKPSRRPGRPPKVGRYVKVRDKEDL